MAIKTINGLEVSQTAEDIMVSEFGISLAEVIRQRLINIPIPWETIINTLQENVTSLINSDSHINNVEVACETDDTGEISAEGAYNSGTLTITLYNIKGERGNDGTNGKSAYECALESGFVGTEEQWLASLHGAQGEKGDKGADGKDGVDGKDGKDGTNGRDGNVNVVDSLNSNSTTDAPSVHAVKQALENLPNNPTGGNATNVVEMSRYSEIVYSADSVSPNVRILSDEIHSGDYVLFDFVIKDVSGAIKLYDENDNEIDTIGASNLSETMQHWQVKSKIPYNYSYAKAVWGRGLLNVKVLKAISAINDDVELNIMPSSLNSFKLCKSWIEPFFTEEMETTLKTLDTLTRQNCIVMPILTDSHVGTTMDKYNSAYHTLANVRYLCQNIFCDAVAHLGDILQARWNDMWINQGYTQEATDEITYRAMSDYLGCLFTTNKHVYAVNGNHDGLNVQRFMSNRWYGLVGRRMNADNSIIKTNSAQSYYYVDFDKVNLRCIFLSVPDDNSVFGLTDEQLNWFASTALDVKEGYNVIILSHIPHIHENFTRNKDQYVGICNAFNAHSTYSTYDYTSLTHGEKIVCEFGGHLHAEKIYNIGEEYTSTNGVMRANLLPCASVFLPATAAIINPRAKDEYDCISHNRMVNTVSQDAFDTMVYAPNENKIYLVRFGVGEDRVILF